DRGPPRGLRLSDCRRRTARAEAARQAGGDSSRAGDRRETLSGRLRASSRARVRELGPVRPAAAIHTRLLHGGSAAGGCARGGREHRGACTRAPRRGSHASHGRSRAVGPERRKGVYLLYGLLTSAADLAVGPALRLRRFAEHRERLGLYSPELVETLRGRKVVWLHNASV